MIETRRDEAKVAAMVIVESQGWDWERMSDGRRQSFVETVELALEAAAKVRAERERADVVLHINNTIGVERADMRFSRIKNGLPVFEGQAIEVNLKKGDSVVIRPIGGKEEKSE